jgi:hypothetical protein
VELLLRRATGVRGSGTLSGGWGVEDGGRKQEGRKEGRKEEWKGRKRGAAMQIEFIQSA